jgi:hypothetical protein
MISKLIGLGRISNSEGVELRCGERGLTVGASELALPDHLHRFDTVNMATLHRRNGVITTQNATHKNFIG